MNATQLKSSHDAGLDYETYLATDPVKAERWRAIDRQIEVSAAQKTLIESYTRQMRVLCVSGIWCGDCVAQGPLIRKIAEANPRMIDLKWVDSDEHHQLAEQVAINAGLRVPTVIFMAEDYEPVSVFGDRTLTRYRAIAAKQLGPSCPHPGAPIPQDELQATLQEWLNEFERVHLLLRLSTRLRQKHGD